MGAARPTTGHFFRINMRSHHLSCLGMAHPEDGKQKVHDMTVIKRSTAGQLRYGSPPYRLATDIWINKFTSLAINEREICTVGSISNKFFDNISPS